MVFLKNEKIKINLATYTYYLNIAVTKLKTKKPPITGGFLKYGD